MERGVTGEETHVEHDDFEPSPELKRELNRRIKYSDNPVRYVVVSELIAGKRYLYYMAESNCYGMDLDQASLFKEFGVAEAVRKALDQGIPKKKKRDRHIVLKITTKNKTRKPLKYFR